MLVTCRLAFALFLGLAPVLAAAAPRVVTDIGPTYGLVARVMAGVGTPMLATPKGASPHDYRMRPSDARRLADADLVIWMGPALTPWLGRYVDGMAGQATSVELLTTPGLDLLPLPEGHDDGHGHGHGGGDNHSDGKGHDDHDGHGEASDPHIWLDPANARLLTARIAEALAAADPANADAYAANRDASIVEIAALRDEIDALLAPVRARPFIVQHDAYRYFERRFGLKASAALQDSDASAPGARRLAAVRNVIEGTGARCLFQEYGAPDRLADAAADGLDMRRAVLAPAGRDLPLGPDLYPRLLRGMAETIRACLE